MARVKSLLYTTIASLCWDNKNAKPFLRENGSRSRLYRETQITNIEIGSDAFFEDYWYIERNRNPRQIWAELAVQCAYQVLSF